MFTVQSLISRKFADIHQKQAGEQPKKQPGLEMRRGFKPAQLVQQRVQVGGQFGNRDLSTLMSQQSVLQL